MSSGKRSIAEQVKSGFLIAGELVGGLLLFLLAVVSLRRLISPAPTVHLTGLLAACIALAVAIVVIYVTAERWGGFIPGFFFIQSAWKGAFYVIFPSGTASPHRVARPEAGFLAAYSLLMIAMLWRFIPPRRIRVSFVDRLALTIFALSVAVMMALPDFDRITDGLPCNFGRCSPSRCVGRISVEAREGEPEPTHAN
jgi:hypothetical protein